MSRAGIRRAIGFIAAPHRSYSSCTQYRENVRDARNALLEAGLAGRRGHLRARLARAIPMFIEANAEHVETALQALPPGLPPRATLVFTAHSIPDVDGGALPVPRAVRRDARGSSPHVSGSERPAPRHATVYQSRSGRPEDPWLGPDVCDYPARPARVPALDAAVLCPSGSSAITSRCSTTSTSRRLPCAARSACRWPGPQRERPPAFLEMMADVVLATERRYQSGRPLSLIPQPV